jgi:Gpi18-like mannosyltransferase
MRGKPHSFFFWSILRNVLLLITSFGIFLFLIYPTQPKTLTVKQIHEHKLNGFKTLTTPVQAEDGSFYAWTLSQTKFFLTGVSRTTPLKVSLRANFDRPLANAEAPAIITVSEIINDKRNILEPLTSLKADPSTPGLQTYTFEVPARLQADDVLGIELKTNTIKIPGYDQAVGVKLEQMQAEVVGPPYAYFLWPYPYLQAVLLLIVSLLCWSSRAKLSWVETTLLIVPFSLLTVTLLSFLLTWSWGLCGLGVISIVLALIWQRPWKISLKQLKLLKTDRPHHQVWPILLGGLAVSLYFLAAPSFSYDTNLFMDWNNKTHLYSPINIYKHVPNLDYPPLIVYILWVYGWILAPFGLTNNLLAFRIFVTLGALAVGLVIWQLARKNLNLGNQQYLPLIMLSLGAANLFNPIVWGQVDSLVGLMLLIGFWLVYRQRFILAGVWFSLLVLFKPQAWILLPLLGILLVKLVGWKKSFMAGAVGIVTTLVLAVPAFGGNIDAFIKFWLQPSLAGTAQAEAATGTLDAFNLHWLLGFSDKPADDLATWVSFGLIAIIYLVVAIRVIWKDASEKEVSLGGALLMGVFFLLSIKMRERYLYYTLPLLAWACLYNRRLIKPYLVLSITCLINMIYGYLKNRPYPTPTAFYNWTNMILPKFFSWLTLLTLLYIAWLYLGPILNSKLNLSRANLHRNQGLVKN